MWPFKKQRAAFIGVYQFEVDEITQLAKYNAEKSRGLMHTEEWKQKMKALQKTYDESVPKPIIFTPGEVIHVPSGMTMDQALKEKKDRRIKAIIQTTRATFPDTQPPSDQDQD